MVLKTTIRKVGENDFSLKYRFSNSLDDMATNYCDYHYNDSFGVISQVLPNSSYCNYWMEGKDDEGFFLLAQGVSYRILMYLYSEPIYQINLEVYNALVEVPGRRALLSVAIPDGITDTYWKVHYAKKVPGCGQVV